jgi:hypothetical protein
MNQILVIRSTSQNNLSTSVPSIVQKIEKYKNEVQSSLLIFIIPNLDVLALQARGQRLGQFISLLRVGHNQSVQMTGASDLELCLDITLSDLDQLGVASAGLLKEVADICDLFRHFVNLNRLEKRVKRKRR